MNAPTDYVTSVMDSVKPLIHAQQFRAVCEQIAPSVDAAIEQGLATEAASLSAILASFLSICGDDQAALEALQRAERLAPTEFHHASVRDHQAGVYMDEILQGNDISPTEVVALANLHVPRFETNNCRRSRAHELGHVTDYNQFIDALLFGNSMRDVGAALGELFHNEGF